MTESSQPRTTRWVYRWPRAPLVRGLGLLVVGLGALWLLVTLAVAVTSLSGRIMYAVLVTVSLLVLAVAGFLLAVPPTVLELTPEGYRVRHVRGGGTGGARWKDVRSVTTGESVAGPVLVLEGTDRLPSIVPLTLLGSRADEAQAHVRALLNDAHGYRPL